MTMPNFFIVGAQKAGTTSLYHYLNQHPQVYMSPRKEPHFFEGMDSEFRRPGRRSVPVRDLAEYQAHSLRAPQARERSARLLPRIF